MKKASNIMYILAIIFGILGAIPYIIIAIVGFTGGAFANDIIKELYPSGGAPADVNAVWIALLCIGIFSLISAFICGAAKSQLNKGTGSISLQITAIIFGVLGLGVFPILGGIFGIVATKNNN